jgi:preprotein translocase subunit SecD
MKLGLDLQGGSYLVYEVNLEKIPENQRRGDEVDRAIEIIRNRVDQFGVAEPVIQKQGENRIVVQLPGLQDPERAKELVGKTARLEFRLVKTKQEFFQALTVMDQTMARRQRADAPGYSAAADTAAVNNPFSAPAAGEPRRRLRALFGGELRRGQAMLEEVQGSAESARVLPEAPFWCGAIAVARAPKTRKYLYALSPT